MKILKTIDHVPGGIILAPMLLSALIRTAFPGALEVGGVTTRLFSSYGSQVFIGALLFLSGSQIAYRDLGRALARGGVLLLGKILIGVAVTTLYLRLFGAAGILGVSALAVCVASLSLNPGTFLAVVTKHGDAIDPAGFGLYNLLAAPSAAAVTLGLLSGARFDYMSIVTTLIPFLLGFLLGNLDGDLRSLFAGATRPTLFFAGITFGAAVDLMAVVRTGPGGILLALGYSLLCGGGLLLVDRLVLRQKGYAATSLSCVAGVAVTFPAAVAEALPEYAAFVPSATAQVAAGVVITTVISVLVTRRVLKSGGNSR